MSGRLSEIALSILLICSLTACAAPRVTSRIVPGKELSKVLVERRIFQDPVALTKNDEYSVIVSKQTCTADYVKTESEKVNRTRTVQGSSVQESDQVEGVVTREFLDETTRTCFTEPVTSGTVAVSYREQSLNLTPSARGLVRLPLRHIAYMENLEQKTTIIWQYGTSRMKTVANFTAEQKRDTVKNYLNRLVDDKLFTMKLNDRSGFYRANDNLMEEIRNELPKYYRLERVSNLPAEQKHANKLPRKGATAAQSGDRPANRPPEENRSMNRLAGGESMADERLAYRLVPTQPNLLFRSGDYLGNIELPTIDYNETPQPVQVQTNVMARKVNNLLPNYENEDRNMKVALKDTNMTLINKTDRPLRLNKMSMYYNGKYVDNVLQHPMELAPGSRQEVPLGDVIERDLGLMAKYGSLNAQQAQRMKINFGLGASYQDPQSNAPQMMNKVNSYDVYQMIKNRPETAKLGDHMLSLIDDTSAPSSELREMLANSRKVSEAYDPSELQFDLNIEFDTGKSDIKKEYLGNLKKVGLAMQKFPKLKGIIEGHTDNVGTEEANQALSERRAEAVKQYLVQTFGLNPKRLQAEGFGTSRPLADNDSAEGRAQNRRIEGRIMEFGA